MEQTAAHHIRQRIIWLIVRAFIGVVLVTVLTVMVITGIALSNSLAIPPFNQLPVVPRLEGYYLGHGNWQGVEPILRADPRLVGEPHRLGEVHDEGRAGLDGEHPPARVPDGLDGVGRDRRVEPCPRQRPDDWL